MATAMTSGELYTSVRRWRMATMRDHLLLFGGSLVPPQDCGALRTDCSRFDGQHTAHATFCCNHCIPGLRE
jgi:hypothetical protein